jgi:SNF2 family DNA or RNA helicase
LKKEYRDKILGKISSEGIEKTAFLILEGLNKLRMACDCPSLVKEGSEHPFKQESIKLKEVIREIQENSGPHKFLIFSQFLGMLDLIKNELNQIGIKHLYLDGSTPAKDRQGLVDTFQTDPDVKAFLISIKAGGVGLNLTAADYVYIVDPWWNPAVEDQAIDRTHRIGQQNKIFAYKLICQDTIEEKIQLLQQKKKDLAKEIIMEEASFIKKLTKDDIAWLLE